MKTMRVVVSGAFLFCLTIPFLFDYEPPRGSEPYFKIIGDYLNGKEYRGNEVRYTQKDLTVPLERWIGHSVLLVYRCTPFLEMKCSLATVAGSRPPFLVTSIPWRAGGSRNSI